MQKTSEAVQQHNVAVTTNTNVVISNTRLDLTTIISERKQWESTTYASSNKQLYSILAKCYSYYREMSDNTDSAKAKRREVASFIKRNGIRVSESTHGISKVLKCVFFDGEKSIDRRRISTYSIVLRSALADNIGEDKLADFIEQFGGVQEIRLKKSGNRISTKERIELGREKVQNAVYLDAFESSEIFKKFDASEYDQPVVALAVMRATGTLEIVSILKNARAVNAALYSEAANEAARKTEAA